MRLSVRQVRFAATTSVLGVLFMYSSSYAQPQSTIKAPQAALRTSLIDPKRTDQTHGIKAFDVIVRLYGENIANDRGQAQTARLDLRPGLQYQLSESVDLKTRMRITTRSAYAQAQYAGDMPDSSFVALKEGYLRYRPFSVLTLRAGAINQEEFNQPLFANDEPFPGLVQELSFGPKAFQVEFKTQQLVPTSSTLSTKAVDAEVSPNFFSETAAVKSRPTRVLLLGASVTHFVYQNLPSTVARESEKLGNTVANIGPNSGRFVYAFNGFVYGANAEARLAKGFTWNGNAYYIRNSSSPDSYNSAAHFKTGVGISFPNEMILSPYFESFYLESDAVPAYYSEEDYFFANRVGWGGGLEAKFKRQGFRLNAFYVDADLINPSTVQTHGRLFILRFETVI